MHATTVAIDLAKDVFQLAYTDAERSASFQERNWTRMREGLERMQRTYDHRIDRVGLRYGLLGASALPADQRIAPLLKGHR